MTETKTFPKGLSATFDVHSCILQIYQKGDLKEIIRLKGYEDEWTDNIEIEGELYSFNVWKNYEGFHVDIYATMEFEGEILTSMYECEPVKLELI